MKAITILALGMLFGYLMLINAKLDNLENRIIYQEQMLRRIKANTDSVAKNTEFGIVFSHFKK